MRLGRPIVLIALLAAALGCTTALASPGKLIDKGTDNGFPIAYARGFAENPKALLLRVKAKPRSPVEVLWQVTCVQNAKQKVPDGSFVFTPTKTKKLKKGQKRPDNCTVDVQAAYDDASISGEIKIELFARPRGLKLRTRLGAR